MALTFPPALVAAVLEGRAVLFVGAGASRGAMNASLENIPDGRRLADLVISKFLGAEYVGLDFKSAYDLACSQRDVATVQRFVFETLNPFQPADFHKLIPKFAWAGIAGTNYDLIIERAYKTTPGALQRLEPNVKDGDHATDRIADRAILYVKLHGCITRYTETSPPLVASTEQLIAFRHGREGQFSTFLEWAKTKTIIFCGYAFLDNNLRTLFDEIIREGDKRPKHYIVNKGLRSAETDYWRDRRVEAIDASFQDFLEALDAQTDSVKRALALAVIEQSYTTSFTRFITTPNAQPSDDLVHYLNSFIEHVGPDIDPADGDPARFFSGFDLGWFPMKAQLDVRLSLLDEIVTSHIVPTPAERLPIVLIKGHAGSGKTVALRRLCYDAATKYGKLCFYVSRQHIIQPAQFEEIFSLTNLPILIFVDNVSEHRDKLTELMHVARARKAPIKIIATETHSVWNVLCDDLEPHVADVHEMRYLSEAQIDALLERLEQFGCLGYLQTLSLEQRRHELRHVHSRQLLVALLEATHGLALVDLVESEYRSIPSAEAQLLYLDICSLHRFGPPVRAGLISRIHNISFDEFKEKLFKPLEAIVVLRKDRRSGDYVYEARHSYIAHTVYEAVVKKQEQRFDNLIRIVTKLNPNYSYDLEVIAQLVKAETLQKTLSDDSKIRQVYDAAEAALGERAVLFHQRGIFEMHIASNMGQLDVAEQLFLRAQTLEPYNRSIHHSLAELDLHRSRRATDPLERQAWRQRAIEQANALASKGTSPYPHHTLLKAAIDSIKDAIPQADAANTEAADLKLGECITNAEAILKRGLQQFPNESILLAEEGELSRVLAQASRAEIAFEKSFAANQRSTLIAKKLARIKRAKGLHGDALQVLQKSLEFNPGSPDIHYDFAMCLLESSPDADQTKGDELLYHLRRSFSPGDKNLQAQFWYARQLALGGKFDDARPIFRELTESKVPFREKIEQRGIVLGPDGAPKEFVGAISLIREAFGFVKCDAPILEAFFSRTQHTSQCDEYLEFGAQVRFKLAFSLRGPIAFDIQM